MEGENLGNVEAEIDHSTNEQNENVKASEANIGQE